MYPRHIHVLHYLRNSCFYKMIIKKEVNIGNYLTHPSTKAKQVFKKKVCLSQRTYVNEYYTKNHHLCILRIYSNHLLHRHQWGKPISSLNYSSILIGPMSPYHANACEFFQVILVVVIANIFIYQISEVLLRSKCIRQALKLIKKNYIIYIY